MSAEGDLDRVKAAWRAWCSTLEKVGVETLDKCLTRDSLDLAEGLRYLSRIARLSLVSHMENRDSLHPYFFRPLDPTMKMGGDNPCGLYLSAPINGSDTFRVVGSRGSAAWISFLSQRSIDCFGAGLGIFGDALFTDIELGDDGRFEIILAPKEHPGNWIETDRFSSVLIVRQFFADWNDVRPMDLTIENLTRGGTPKPFLSIEEAVGRMERATQNFMMMLPAMQAELASKAGALNRFAPDVGDFTKNQGGVPGGSAVTMRWRLEAGEALVIRIVPPSPCAYWDIQVGNIWYESFDYRHFFSGIADRQAVRSSDGSIVVVLSELDPGTPNWLQTAGHREGHLAVRWQLTDGQLPLPECRVVQVTEAAGLTGGACIDAATRSQQRKKMRQAVERRFRP